MKQGVSPWLGRYRIVQVSTPFQTTVTDMWGSTQVVTYSDYAEVVFEDKAYPAWVTDQRGQTHISYKKVYKSVHVDELQTLLDQYGWSQNELKP